MSNALPSAAKPKRRWLRFSLRSLLIAMTLICVGIVAKQQYDWWRMRQLIHQWIAPLVERAEAAGGDVMKYEDNQLALATPEGMRPDEELAILRYGILELEKPVERVAALKILIETRGEESLPVIRELILRCRHRELQATLLHVLCLARDAQDLPLFENLLDSPSPEVRAAAAESIGYVKQPAYDDLALAEQWWPSYSQRAATQLSTLPPLRVPFLIDTKTQFAIANDPTRVPLALRERLEKTMLGGSTVEERTAAARALVGWPPDKYTLRVGEWGVWIDEGSGRLVSAGVLDEIPEFVHRTGNPLASIPRNRVQWPMIVTKPIIHLTADRPLSVDLEISITGGRPWYVFPRPCHRAVQKGPLRGEIGSGGGVEGYHRYSRNGVQAMSFAVG